MREKHSYVSAEIRVAISQVDSLVGVAFMLSNVCPTQLLSKVAKCTSSSESSDATYLKVAFLLVHACILLIF
jgi:hypothetical protein